MPKIYEFATLDSVVDALNDGRRIALDDVRPSLRDSWIHVGYRGMPGYMPEDGSHFYATSRRRIVDAHCESVCQEDESDRAPNGFRRSLLAGGSGYSRDGRTVYETDSITIREAIGG